MQVELPGITLVGTAHVSAESVAEVRDVVARVKPAVVAVELDENRKRAIVDKKRFEETPITDLLRSGKSSFILAQSLLASYQRRMGAKYGVEPGAEMVAAIHAAEASGAKLALVDRDIGVTLRRAYAKMGFGERIRLAWELIKSLAGAGDDEEIDVEEILQEDVLTAMMGELSAMAPTVADVLIHERDAYLAAHIREAAKDGHVVAVLGAGHLAGVEKYLRAPDTIPDTKPLEVIPKRFPWGLVVTILLSLVIAGYFAFSFYKGVTTGDFSDFTRHLKEYVIVMGGMCALGALAAAANPLAILTAFVAAPTKIIHPFVGSGIFPGLVQAKMNKPTMKDFQGISHLQAMRDLYRNKLTHVLLVASLSQLFADVGLLLLPIVFRTGLPFVH
ncbi:MAG: hypothetical protein QOE90_759 [Thermoplasmata archaeon]|jgi:pheromone shutdown-related protein TraB|nr:hypothetical protein [Thermoplasmata archaeon]